MAACRLRRPNCAFLSIFDVVVLVILRWHQAVLQQQPAGGSAGLLNFSIFPLDERTDDQLDYLEDEDDPFDVLLGKTLLLHFDIGAASGVPDRLVP